MITDQTIHQFLDDLASKAPTPGGGSAAALLGAVAAGLVSMVGQYTVGREKFRDVEPEARRILERSEALRAELTRLAQADIEAFGEVSAAYRLPRVTDEEKAARSEAIQASLITATEAPMATARAARELISLCADLAPIGNPQTVSDVGVGALAADACLQSAALNVAINLKAMKNADRAAAYQSDLDTLLEKRESRLAEVLETVRQRL